MDQKQTLRVAYKKRLQQLSEGERSIASSGAAKMFCRHVELAGAKKIGIYMPIVYEISPMPLAMLLQKLGYELYLPRAGKKATPLGYHYWEIGGALEEHPHFPVHEPPANAKQAVPDIMLVPMLAFDKHRYRLGYGGGYYDATIEHYKKENPSLCTVGYAYECQRASAVPRETHDQQLDQLITEQGLY